MKKLFKEHELVKVISLMLILIVLLSWLIPSGTFGTGGAFTEGEMWQGIGLVHIFYGFVFGIQNYSIQICFLLCIGMFYGILCKTENYKALVSKLEKLGKGKEVIFALVSTFLFAVLASVLNNTMVLLIFVPFAFTVLRRIGLNKISAFVSTFGAMLVGVLGATIGTEGMIGFIDYLGYGGAEITLTTELVVRIGILVLAFVLYSFFEVLYLKKHLKEKALEKDEDLFQVEEPKKKHAKAWPAALVFIVLLVFAVLGFVSWTEINVTVFQDFHTWLMELAIGEVSIFGAIFGNTLPNLAYSLVPAFGEWYLFTYLIVVLIVTLIAAIIGKVKWNELFDSAWDGMKKLVKPTLFLVLAYMVFVFIYWCPFMPTIINALGTMTSSFNPFISTLQAFIGSIFNSDLAYLGFSLNYYLASYTGAEGNIVFLIFITIYGLIQFVTPISVYLLFGLSYANVSYKKWLQYIWKFFVGMLVCLLVIFTLLTYL